MDDPNNPDIKKHQLVFNYARGAIPAPPLINEEEELMPVIKRKKDTSVKGDTGPFPP